ncbi:MAG: alpha/beta hydrolase [Lachnospiraceae bacterium]|nr:alpha/beta hydrolase [Lachnospiraceae bacterium]
METRQRLMRLVKLAHGLVEKPDLEKHRQSQDQIGELMGRVKDLTFRGMELDGIHCEWVSLNRAHVHKQIIMHCHGGGYSTGSSLYARTLTAKLAASTAMEVLSFDYRLAPEHPYPAALEDALRVWDYLMRQGYGARDVILTGDSAGGNLALALTLKLKEQGRFLPRGLVLMSPWTDLTSSGESFVEKKDLDPVLDATYMERVIHDYAKGEKLQDPYISPLFGDFTGFPPTYVQVGENEILLSDSTRLVDRMKDANVTVKLDVFPGMWHVFQMAPFKTAYEAMDKNVEFIIDELMHF